MTLGERIKHLRKNMNMTQVDFGRFIGVSGATISTSESGKTTPDSQTIEIICMKCNVNRDWLMYGVGQMEASRPFVPELMRILNQHPALKSVLESMVTEMDAEDWAALNNIARKHVAQKQKKDG